jgi:diketogulonate reductase-like aldo/keto reductase
MKRRTLNQAILLWPLLGKLSNRAVKQQPIHPIGMGTWITFDHRPKDVDQSRYVTLLEAFFAAGGQMIDSSPMYGHAQQLLGQLLPQSQGAKALFAATKVWTMGQSLGQAQMAESARLWGQPRINLMYVHNLLDWQTHLPVLRDMRAQGTIDYLGVTTSHGRRHEELIRIMQREPVDFVQFTYNIHDREAEQYLLPLAADKGIQVVINRPFQTGGLFTRVAGKPLPDWASELQCEHWAQLFLKFIIAHPAVTCAIPATSQLAHMQQNMQAANGPMPDAVMRQEMVRYWQQIRR